MYNVSSLSCFCTFLSPHFINCIHFMVLVCYLSVQGTFVIISTSFVMTAYTDTVYTWLAILFTWN